MLLTQSIFDHLSEIGLNYSDAQCGYGQGEVLRFAPGAADVGPCVVAIEGESVAVHIGDLHRRVIRMPDDPSLPLLERVYLTGFNAAQFIFDVLLDRVCFRVVYDGQNPVVNESWHGNFTDHDFGEDPALRVVEFRYSGRLGGAKQ